MGRCLTSPPKLTSMAFFLLSQPLSSPLRTVRILFIVYSFCFLIGTYTHIKDLINNGFLAHPVPLAIGLFWNVLTLLDLLAVLLLWRYPKVGLCLSVTIMAADISVNTLVYLAGYFGPSTPHMVPLSLFEQSLFGLFVFVTAPIAYRALTKMRVAPTAVNS